MGMTSEAKALVAGLIEDALELLTIDADKLKVYQPSNLEKFDDMDDGGHILVMYSGSKYGENTHVYAVQQTREITITVVIESLNIPGRMTPEDYLDLVIDALISAELTADWRQSGKQITMQGDELAGENNGRWRYILDVNVPGEIWGVTA